MKLKLVKAIFGFNN